MGVEGIRHEMDAGNKRASHIVVVPGSVARTTARWSSWAVSHRTPELKVVTFG